MTTSTTLTERYIHAATRSVPEKSRTDLRAELEASIADAIDARVEQGESPDAAERAVLTDMGDPDRLAADYTDRPAFLIGPRYYFEWMRLVKVLFAVVLPLAILGVGLGQLLSGAGIGQLIGAVVVGALTISLHLLFWPTLVFALLERSPDRTRSEIDAALTTGRMGQWTLERLPEIRPQGFGVVDLVASLVYVVAVVGAILWDQFVGFVFAEGTGVPVIDPALWSLWIPFMLVVLVAVGVFAVVRFRVGRWTRGLAIVNALLAIAFAVPIVWIVAQDALLNPVFLETVAVDDVSEVSQVVNIVVGCTAVAVAVWDVIDGFVKAARLSRVQRP